VEFVTTTIRSDVAGLTTKIYNIKTSLFEQSNDLSTLKATHSHVQSAVDKLEMRVADKAEEDKAVQTHMEDMKSDIFAIRCAD
jgi:archaellum component FlaC